MDLELKPEYHDQRITSTDYPCSKEDQDEIMRQVLELVEVGMCEAYKNTEIPEHCSPCFLVAKRGSTAKRLVVDYRKLNTMIKLHAGSLPVMENTIENAASCKFKSKMDKRSGFWQVDLTERAKELMAFRTQNGRVFRWLVMPFGIANAPALFQELMNQVLTILKQRPAVEALLERGAVAEAHIDDVLLGTNSIEDHLLLLSEFFDVRVEQNLRIDAFPWGAWPRDCAVDTRKQAGRQGTALTGASSRSCHVTKRFRILATLKQGNKSMYSNTSGYVHMGLRLDWGKGIAGQ